MKKSNLEMEIYQNMVENRGTLDEETYLMTFELLKDDDEKIEKTRRYLEEKVVKQIQMIFGRMSPECNLEEQSFEDWVKYIFGI